MVGEVEEEVEGAVVGAGDDGKQGLGSASFMYSFVWTDCKAGLD